MTAARITDADARQLFAALRDHRWSWRAADVDALLADLGWSSPARSADGFVLRTPWTLPVGEVPLSVREDDAAEAIFWLTPFQDRPAGAEAYAELATIAADVLGAPAARQTEPRPGESWRFSDAVVELRLVSGTVQLSWASNDYREYQDWLDED